MNLTRNQIIILAGGGLIVVFILFAFLWGRQNSGNQQLQDVTLNVWGVFDDFSLFQDAINNYEKIRTNVRVQYRLMNPATYEQDLVNALAENRGPDIFMFQNSWLPKHINKLVPASASQLTIADFRRLYPTVVEQDFAPDGQIYALPLYIDTLSLLYNRDFFDRKAVALPPKTWAELEGMIPRLREVNQNTGEIVSAAAAIGGSGKSINRMADILSAIFLQSGTQMTDAGFTQATFANSAGSSGLNFYLQFSNQFSPSYTWNDSLHYSIDGFADGNVSMIFNYAYQLTALKRKNPFLAAEVAPLPQFDTSNPITIANYLGMAVSNKSQNYGYAWDFVIYLTTNEANARTYMKASGHPPALRTVINEVVNDPFFGVFAKQALIARSWPQIDNNAVDQSFSNMVESVLSNQLSPQEALRKSADEISQLMQKRR